jgi:putative membrane protein
MIDYNAHHWSHHLFDIKGSMVRQIIARVTVCVAWSAGVTAFHLYVRPIAIPVTLHTLIGLALSLLLVFRTNASYDRFWEGRKQWGGIVNETRNLVRASGVLLARDPVLFTTLVRWTIAWPWSTMHSLRNQRGLGPIAAELPPHEAEEVLAAQHVPLTIATRISALLDEAKRKGLISDYVQMTLDQNVQLLVDYMGACERIHRTPLPFAYVVHLRRALILYCFSLPFALLEPFRWGTVVATLLVAYTFFGIEEIGVEIEDPFGTDDNDLPLERICTTIQGNLTVFIDHSKPQEPDEVLPPGLMEETPESVGAA